MSSLTYASDNRRVVLLAIIYSDWFIIRASGKYTTVVVDSGCDEFLSVWCVCEVSWAGGIYKVQLAPESLQQYQKKHTGLASAQSLVCGHYCRV